MTAGTFTAKVIATDETGSSATKEIVITVAEPAGNGAPTVAAAADPASGKAPLDVSFAASGTDPDGDELTYAWEFGDGTSGAGRRARHVYSANGTYTATVTADDGRGGTDTATVQILVGNPAGNQAPTVAMEADPDLRHDAADGRAAVGLWASKKTARRLGLAGRGLGRAQFDCTAGRTLQLTLKPGRKVRKAIKAARPKSLKITVALAMKDGAPLTRTLTLER
jgi:PKD domain-containing protein